MKDEHGLYYLPTMQDRNVRMYVRRAGTDVEFRLFNAEYPEVWERHRWMPYGAVKKAAEMYRSLKGGDRNPMALYDLDVAQRLLEEDGQ